MSENLSILDGELRRQFAPVDRLSVDNQVGGVSPWIIADFLDISTLSITENGLYLAAEEEYDCYEEVEVDISEELGEGDYRRITGKDPNLDPNNDYAVGLDENGNLTKEMIPAAIHIVVPPRKRKYDEGETLDFSGIHVYLLDGNNHRFTSDNYPTGEIPFDELIFPVTTAEGSEESDEYTDGHGLNVMKITFSEMVRIQTNTFYKGTFVGVVPESWAGWPAGADAYYACTQSGSAYFTIYNNKLYGYGIDNDGYIAVIAQRTWNGNWDFRHNLKLHNWTTFLRNSELDINPPISTEDPNEADIDDLHSSGQEIPVQWMRSDGTILEDKFTIEVGQSEEGEDQPDPWGGYADVSYGGHHYNLNRRIVPEVHYANGYCWQEGTSEYTVEQAVSMGWLILIR